jgi:hypothetical protein
VMDLIFEKYNLFLLTNSRRGYNIQDLNGESSEILNSELMAAYLESTQPSDIPELTPRQEQSLIRQGKKEWAIYWEVSLKEIQREINFNLANIQHDGQVKRYLNYLQIGINENFYYLTRNTDYQLLKSSRVPFFKNHPLSIFVRNFISNVTKMEMLLQYIDYLMNGETKAKKLKAELGNTLDSDPFDSLFKMEYLPYIQSFIDVLTQVTPPLINAKFEWIKPVGAAKVFVETLKEKGVLHPKSSFESIYNGFDFKFKTGKSFMKNSKLVRANDYRLEIEERVDLILNNIHNYPK